MAALLGGKNGSPKTARYGDRALPFYGGFGETALASATLQLP